MSEQRYQAVLAVIAEGCTVTEVAARFGVSRVGVAAAGRNIDVWVTNDVLQFFDGDHLLRTEQRDNTGPVRKKRASIPIRSAVES